MTIQQPHVRYGNNIREVGADLRKGDRLIEAGTLLGPAEVGLLASLGHAEVLVGRRPRVAVISTASAPVDAWPIMPRSFSSVCARSIPFAISASASGGI